MPDAKWRDAGQIRAYMREYNVANRESLNIKKSAYKRAHRDVFNRMQRLRRAAGRSLGTDERMRRAVLALIPWCVACGATKGLEADHVQAVATGGPTTLANLQTLCRRCNAIKGTVTADYRTEKMRRDLEATHAALKAEFERGE